MVFCGRKVPSWLPWALLVLLGAAVFWPAITTPFFLDDYIHSTIVSGHFPGVRGPLSLYDFVANDNREAMFDRGFLPWWTDARLTLRFFRPLSSLFLFCLHSAFGHHALPMHLVTFGWWIAAVFAARGFFRYCVSPRAAALATVIFALAPCHGLPLAWLANSEVIIASAFGLLGMTAMLRWRKGEGAAWGVWSFVAFSLALAAGEYGLAFGGYVVAFALLTEKGAPRRWTAALLFLVPAVAYLSMQRLLGYGAGASGFYQDPLNDTTLFLRHAPWRFGLLILMSWFSQRELPAWRHVGEVQYSEMGTLVVCTVCTVVVLIHVTRQQSSEARRATWALAGGSFISLAPLLAVAPSARLLAVAMVGIGGAVGVILDAAWFVRQTEAVRGLEEFTAIAAMLLGFGHLVHSPGRAWLNSQGLRAHARNFADRADEVAARIDRRDGSDVVVVLGIDDVFFYGFALEVLGVHNTHWTVLAHTGHVLLKRVDDNTIELTVAPYQGLFPMVWGDLYRSEIHPMQQGETFVTGSYFATVTDVDPFGPRRARFHFPTNVDDPGRTWITERGRIDFSDVKIPKAGFGIPIDPF